MTADLQYRMLVMEAGGEGYQHAGLRLQITIERGEVQLAALIVVVEINDRGKIAPGHAVRRSIRIGVVCMRHHMDAGLPQHQLYRVGIDWFRQLIELSDAPGRLA